MKNVLILFGGGGHEHDISAKSKEYLVSQIKKHNVFVIEVKKDGSWLYKNKKVLLNDKKIAEIGDIDFIIPCIHGHPGEDGEIQKIFESHAISYLGCNPTASSIAFDKSKTKDILEKNNFPVVPYLTLNELDESAISLFLSKHEKVFIKANSEGSSVGCFEPKDLSEVIPFTKKAFNFSEKVLIEKYVKGREIEVAAFEMNGELHISNPGEILKGENFYSFEEKYSSQSSASTTLNPNLSPKMREHVKSLSYAIFKTLGLKDLSRIDFFLEKDQLYFNEVNTFPGMTEISLFPKMLESSGFKFSEFLDGIISKS